jgi:hypothetical protein
VLRVRCVPKSFWGMAEGLTNLMSLKRKESSLFTVEEVLVGFTNATEG